MAFRGARITTMATDPRLLPEARCIITMPTRRRRSLIAGARVHMPLIASRLAGPSSRVLTGGIVLSGQPMASVDVGALRRLERLAAQPRVRTP